MDVTWLCSDILDSELHIPNCTIVRQDRNRYIGGVAIYVNNALSFFFLFFSIMNLCIRARGTTVACANIKMYPIYNSAAVAGSVYIIRTCTLN